MMKDKYITHDNLKFVQVHVVDLELWYTQPKFHHPQNYLHCTTISSNDLREKLDEPMTSLQDPICRLLVLSF